MAPVLQDGGHCGEKGLQKAKGKGGGGGTPGVAQAAGRDPVRARPLLGQTHALENVAHFQYDPYQQHRHHGHQANGKDKTQKQKCHPQKRAKHIDCPEGAEGGLTDLGPLRLVTDLVPLLLKFRVVDADLFLRIHPTGQVHGFLLGQSYRNQGEDQLSHDEQGLEPAVNVHNTHCQEKEIQNHSQGGAQYHHIELPIRLLRGGVVLAVPAVKQGSGGAVMPQADAQQHHGADGNSPGSDDGQQTDQAIGEPYADVQIIQNAAGDANAKSKHGADEQPFQKFRKCLAIGGRFTALHDSHPPHRKKCPLRLPDRSWPALRPMSQRGSSLPVQSG